MVEALRKQTVIYIPHPTPSKKKKQNETVHHPTAKKISPMTMVNKNPTT